MPSSRRHWRCGCSKPDTTAHVRTLGLREAEDATIWNHALETGAAIVTKDEDFVARAAHAIDTNSPVIVWLRVGNTTNRALLAWMATRLAGTLELMNQGHRLVEVI